MEQKKIIDPTGAELKPGDPERCQGNGKHPGIECCCDECDYYLECFEEDDAEEEERWLRVCRVQCKICGDVLERTYQSPDDHGGGLMTCTCGNLTLDPGPVCWKINYKEDVYELQHELAEEG